jgi:hypothetical protein
MKSQDQKKHIVNDINSTTHEKEKEQAYIYIKLIFVRIDTNSFIS